jgi:thiol-disulfide isomerase/thioredoxin
MVRVRTAAIALAIVSFGQVARGAADILLLDFWSPQCGPCMQMKPTVHAFEQANYPIQQIDTTRDSEMSRRYNVSQIPCFVMLVDGQEVEREIGPASSERLQQMFQKAKDIYVQRHPAPGQVRGQSPDPNAPARMNSAVGPAPRLDHNPMPQPSMATQPPTVPARRTAIASPANEPQLPAGSSNDFPLSLVSATVRIRVEDAQGRSFGTGTIIDSRSGEALVVTCGHLFRESKGKGPMTIELFDASSGVPQVVEQVPGQLISYDLERDVAFIGIKPSRPVSMATVAPPKTQYQRGDRVATIGCSNGKDPTLLPQRINMLDRYQGPSNIEVSGAPEEGRSGGGLFNLQGQLIGVCYAADYEGKEGLYVALDSIHEELNRLGLKDVYAKGDATSPNAASAPSVVRGQESQEPQLAPITPIADAGPKPTPGSSATLPQNLSEQEQASFGEIMQRASTAEVMIIVRPKTPGGQSEIIQLDNVSPGFVKALEAQRRIPQSPTTR